MHLLRDRRGGGLEFFDKIFFFTGKIPATPGYQMVYPLYVSKQFPAEHVPQ